MTNALAAHHDAETAALAAKGVVSRCPTRAELIAEAGRLNNHPKLAMQDHVTIMGFMDIDECFEHVLTLRSRIAA